MSASLVKAHGGSKDLMGSKGQIMNTGMFITNTMAGKDRGIHEKHLSNLIANTTGTPSGKPIMEGVLTSTKHGAMDKDVPELHKTHHRGKTQPKRMGQVPYGGRMY
jgi:hypothetical protein